KCFDRIDHQALLAKLPAPPGIRRQVRAWLQSGIMEDDVFSPTTAGTPQGGSVSPLLALIALHGMDTAITQVYPEARVIAYADDCVRHEARCVHGARHLPPTVGRQVYPPSLQAEQLAGQGTPGETTGSTGIVANP